MNTTEFTITKKKKVAFIDLIRPHQVFDIDERFEIYRWMVSTARNYYKPKISHKESYGYEAIALLSKSSAWGHGPCTSRLYEDWEEDLKSRFQYALLDQYAYPDAIKWREEQGVDINNVKFLPIRQYSGGCPQYPKIGMDLPRLLKAIFAFKGAILKEQYNQCHAKADTILDISIGVYPNYNLCVHYGYQEDFGNKSAASWAKDIPPIVDELFWDWANRIYLILKDMVVDQEDSCEYRAMNTKKLKDMTYEEAYAGLLAIAKIKEQIKEGTWEFLQMDN